MKFSILLEDVKN